LTSEGALPSVTVGLSTARVGRGSSSAMVSVALSGAPIIAPTGLPSVRLTVSPASSSASLLIGTVKLCVVTPGANESVQKVSA
jgi:hypothetical protein